jgi:hypothetical protein
VAHALADLESHVAGLGASATHFQSEVCARLARLTDVEEEVARWRRRGAF